MQTTPVSGGRGPQKNELETNKAHTSKIGEPMLGRIGLASKLEGFNLNAHQVTLGGKNHTADFASQFFKRII